MFGWGFRKMVFHLFLLSYLCICNIVLKFGIKKKLKSQGAANLKKKKIMLFKKIYNQIFI